MKKVFGLVGYPLQHSFSPQYFKNKFLREGLSDFEYQLFPLDSIGKLPELIKEKFPSGLQVTIPYKEAVIDLLDEVDEEAKAIGAVNTIAISGHETKGYNSDAFGFEYLFLPLLLACQKSRPQALVLGSGGASKAVIYVLKKLN